MKVLAVGATGFVGTELCRELRQRGHDVTALARTPDCDAVPDGVRAVAGDVTDYDAVADAVAGRDVVVNLVGLSPLFTPPGGEGAHERVHLGGTRNVVRAANARGVDRLVQVSALGADPGGPTAYVRAKGRAEAVVRESGLDWTLIRPSVVFGDGGEFVPFTASLTTPYVTGLPGGGATRFQPLWVGDLAAMLADAVADDAHVGETYELGGPEALTLADVARRVYRAEGKSVRVLPVPMVLARAGLTVAGAIPGVPMGPDQYRSLRFDNAVADNDVRAFGLDPTDLRTLDDYLAAGSPRVGGGPGTASPGGGGSQSEPPERGGESQSEPPERGGESQSEPTRTDGASPESAGSAWTSRATLLLSAFLALGHLLPAAVDIYAFGGVPLLFFVPSYLVSMVAYDAPWGLENVVYALAPDGGKLLWEAGLVATYYLAAVASTWVGRRLESAAASLKRQRGAERRGSP